MMVENQNLQITLQNAEARKNHLEQKIEFRKNGGSSIGRFTSELIEVKSKINSLKAEISRESNKATAEETEAFLKDYDEKERIKKEEAELVKEREEAKALFEDIKSGKTKPKPIFKTTPRPDFSEIGIRMKKERNLEGALEKAQADFDSAKQKAEKRSPVGTGNRTVQLTRARNNLKMAKFDIEHLPIVIDFYELRAELKWQETVLTELKERKIEQEAEITELKSEFALLKKHGYIKPEMVLI